MAGLPICGQLTLSVGSRLYLWADVSIGGQAALSVDKAWLSEACRDAIRGALWAYQRPAGAWTCGHAFIVCGTYLLLILEQYFTQTIVLLALKFRRCAHISCENTRPYVYT